MKFLLLTALVWCICATAFSSPYLVVSDVDSDVDTWVVMTLFYSSLDLHKLNCSYPLPATFLNPVLPWKFCTVLDMSTEDLVAVFVRARSSPPGTVSQY